MAAQALSAADLEMTKQNAKEFFKRFPRVKAKELSWGERLLDREARDAYAIATIPQHKMAIAQLGARPCIRCGEVTTAFCEGCAHPAPFALCSKCDSEKLLCHRCISDGKLYSAVASADPNVLEVSGWNDEQGNFVPLEPPLRVDAASIPTVDGVLDLEVISALVKAHWEQQVARSSSSTAPSGQNAGGWANYRP